MGSKKLAIVNEAKVLACKEGRAAADTIYSLVLEDISRKYPNHGADFAEALLARLKELLPQRAADQPPPGPPPCPIARLGLTGMEYGRYTGKTYDEIPQRDLAWYADIAEDNVRMLREYLNHPDFESHRRALGWVD